THFNKFSRTRVGHGEAGEYARRRRTGARADVRLHDFASRSAPGVADTDLDDAVFVVRAKSCARRRRYEGAIQIFPTGVAETVAKPPRHPGLVGPRAVSDRDAFAVPELAVAWRNLGYRRVRQPSRPRRRQAPS